MTTDRLLLVMLLGVPGSGKTYFSERLAEKLCGVRLNSDAMRLAIFGSLDIMNDIYHSENRSHLNDYTSGALGYVTDQLLGAGVSVVYDAIHTTRDDRQKQEAVAAKYGALPILLRVTVPREVALRRIVDRPAKKDVRQFTAEKADGVIRQFEDVMEAPIDGELVIDIDGELSFEEQYASFERQLASLAAKAAA